MINKAGVVHGGEFLGMTFADIDRVMNVDFWGAGNSELFDRTLARTTPQRAAALILRGAALGRPRVLIGADAWALSFAESLSHRLRQRTVVSVFRRLERSAGSRKLQARRKSPGRT